MQATIETTEEGRRRIEDTLPQYVSITQAAGLIGADRKTVWRHVHAGKLKAHRLTERGKIWIRTADLLDLLERRGRRPQE